ncbi:protein OSB1, mitochondrial isoform X2 [Raphanus sativus]|uniref:Protein OSB1, mitochondrial isoform X2 n=1 Tax=Raphanus sativus TaxID=3726 RepID=A0A9W3CCF7_RAPSA|nr:protein OSB1, mitochondrial isoform X2 [Raphanus sativus]
MNKFFKLGSLIRITASRIPSNQHLPYAKSLASSAIPKPRFFSNVTDDESALYHHARMFRKPLSTGYKFNLSNSVSLMGFVDQPIRVIDTEPDRFGVSTLLRVKDPRDPNRSFRIPLSIWDVMARKCVAHLKPNDFVFVSGRLVSYDKSSGNENSGFGLHYQVKVSEVNHVMAPPSHVLDSEIPQKPKSETVVREDGSTEESKNGDIDLWEAFFANPDDWWDRRRSKKNPRLPDFKHKDTDEALWLSSDTPVWVTSHLELLDQRRGDDTEEPEHDEIHLWKALFANPDEWWDKRRNKKSPKLPDFKHKDTGEALWLNSETPVWVTRQLELLDQSKPDGIEESNDDKIYLWQVFFANPNEWWDKRKSKTNPRQPDFTHKDTSEALWLDSDVPVWVTRQLELYDQSNSNKSCYDPEQTGRGRLGDWV